MAIEFVLFDAGMASIPHALIHGFSIDQQRVHRGKCLPHVFALLMRTVQSGCKC